MKSKILSAVLISACLFGLSGLNTTAKGEQKEHISLSGAFALYPMAVKWAGEFKKSHPNVTIDISAGGAGKGMADVLNGMVDIGMVSREVYSDEYKKGAHPISVAKDAVVAIVSASNPAIKEILYKGMKKGTGDQVWIYGNCKSWGQFLGNRRNTPIHVYTRSDASGAAEMWAKYFGKKQEDLNGVGAYGDPGITQAVQRDPLGIGFNNIGYAYDAKTKRPVKGIFVVPLDQNNNGKIDPWESFYGNLSQLSKAIATGRYPSPPARELYFVTKGKPQKKIVQEFVYWVLTKGQQYTYEAGYVPISKSKIKTEIKRVY